MLPSSLHQTSLAVQSFNCQWQSRGGQQQLRGLGGQTAEQHLLLLLQHKIHPPPPGWEIPVLSSMRGAFDPMLCLPGAELGVFHPKAAMP